VVGPAPALHSEKGEGGGCSGRVVRKKIKGGAGSLILSKEKKGGAIPFYRREKRAGKLAGAVRFPKNMPKKGISGCRLIGRRQVLAFPPPREGGKRGEREKCRYWSE